MDRRSAVRTADGCVGILAVAVAQRSGDPLDHFVKYANDHAQLSFAPVIIIGFKGLHQHAELRHFPRAALEIWNLRQYFSSETFKTDEVEVKKQRIRDSVHKVFRVVDQKIPEDRFAAMVEEFVRWQIDPDSAPKKETPSS